MIYFDNSATTFFKPKSVINAVKNSLEFLSANPGRSGHSMSFKAGSLVYKTRAHLGKFLGAKNPERIVFTSGCTAAINAAIFGTVKNGGHVITTAYEHNSVLRPLFELQKQGRITITVLPPDENGAVSLRQIQSSLTRNTYLVATNHISNVTGAVTPVKQIGNLLKNHNTIYLVDGAQSVGYGRTFQDEDFIDMLAFAPHKGLHAPQGVGVLSIGENVVIKPTIFGGTGTESENVFQPQNLPESLESGTLPVPAIAGLNAALFWAENNMEDMSVKLNELSSFLCAELKKIGAVTMYSPASTANGIVAFNVANLSSEEVAFILSDQYDICVRGGLHCAPLIHKHLGTLKSGIVRVSLGVDNTFTEIEFLLRAIKEIAGK